MNLKASFASFSLLVMLLVAGCNPCKKVTCEHGGTCMEGTCGCLPGYEGEFCENMSKNSVAATYTVSETCTGSTDSYSCTVQASATDDLQVEFTNFYNLEGAYGFSSLIYGEFTAENTITIASQTRMNTNGDSFTFSGTATVGENGNLTLNYTVDVNGDSDDCTATFTR
ncbi:MAG: hypothetical protein H6581_15910 [Bacteroidia bacterium]|nr:hypothetical protein [Bacteroidia bacterium]